MSAASQPMPAARPGGYAELAAEVRALGLMDRRLPFYAGFLGVILCALAASVTGLLMLHDTWWALLLAPVFAVVSTQIGFFGHDAHPNDLDSDPDVRAGAVVFDEGQAVGRRGVAGWVTRHQAWLFVPMLTLEALNLHRASALAVLRTGLRHRRV